MNEQQLLERITVDARIFGEMAVIRRLPHHGILRLVDIAARRQAALCLHILERHGGELMGGAIITAEPGRLRMVHGYYEGAVY